MLTLKAVTSGTRHHLALGSHLGAWLQKLKARLPGNWVRRFNLFPREDFGTCVTPNPTLALWCHQTASTNNPWPEDTYLEVADESGVIHLPIAHPGNSRLLSTVPVERITADIFDAFPRRAKTLTFYVHSVGTVNGSRQFMLAGSFQLPNPITGPFPVWQPEGLPAIRRDGEMEFALLRLAARTNGVRGPRPRIDSAGAGTEAKFRITRNGAPALDWEVESLQVTDATDNLLYLWRGAGGVSSNGLFFAPRYWLEPGEPAWKVRAEFVHQAGFGPAELATIQSISTSLPVNGAFGGSNRVVALKDTSISIQGIRREPNWGGNASIEVQVAPKTERFRIALVKVTDERGREVAIAKPPRGYGDFRTGATHYFGVTLPDDAEALDLTFAYQECRFAEFVAKPGSEGVPTTNEPRP